MAEKSRRPNREADRVTPSSAGPAPASPMLLAISDLHVANQANREIVESLRPAHRDDWLLVPGDVAEHVSDISWCLGLLSTRFARVIWAPGNYELWTHPRDP